MDEVSDPFPPVFNMAEYCISRWARRAPRKTALVVIGDAASARPTEVWCYADVEAAMLAIAVGLQLQGYRRGDRILIRLGNTSTFALLFFGAIAGGFVPVPVSSQLTGEEAAFIAHDSRARLILLDERLPFGPVPADADVWTAERVARLFDTNFPGDYARTRADEDAFLVYTSGTTGRPTGVLHAHRSAHGRRPMYQGWYGIGPEDRMLHAGALNWTFTLGTGLTDPWANGATAIVYTGKREPEVWPRLLRATDATMFAAVPGLCRQIVKCAAPALAGLSALRHGLIAGETPPPGLFEDWRGHSGTELHEALGMTEISTYVSTSPTLPRRPGTVGRAQPGRRIAILPRDSGDEPLPAGAEGLLAVHRSDPGLMKEYWIAPENRRDDRNGMPDCYRGEWFVGGDLAAMDKDGYVTHLGRANDLMNAMGYRVSPLEIESVLLTHPGIAEAACAEIAVRDGVRVIAAFIVPHHGARLDPGAVRAFASEHLAAYKVPREIRFVDALPRTANGKIQRRRLG